MIFRNSVDSLMKGLTKKIGQLEVVAALHNEEQKVHDRILADVAQAKAYAQKEEARALAIIAKIRALVE